MASYVATVYITPLYPTEAIHQRNKVCCIAVITLRNIKSVVITLRNIESAVITLRNIKRADQSYTEL